MEMMIEVMGDVIDDVFEGEDEEEETDEFVNAVLDELGCNVGVELILVFVGKVGVVVDVEWVVLIVVLEGGLVEFVIGGGGFDDDL